MVSGGELLAGIRMPWPGAFRSARAPITGAAKGGELPARVRAAGGCDQIAKARLIAIVHKRSRVVKEAFEDFCERPLDRRQYSVIVLCTVGWR